MANEVSIPQLIGQERTRLYKAASSLQEQLAAIDFGQSAYDEASTRAKALADRAIPCEPTPHGFYNFPGFIEASQRRDANHRFYIKARERLFAKIVARDGLLPAMGA